MGFLFKKKQRNDNADQLLDSVFKLLTTKFNEFEFIHELNDEDEFEYTIQFLTIKHKKTKTTFKIYYDDGDLCIRFFEPTDLKIANHETGNETLSDMHSMLEDIFPFVSRDLSDGLSIDFYNLLLEKPKQFLFFDFDYEAMETQKHVEMFSWMRNNCKDIVNYPVYLEGDQKFATYFNNEDDLVAVKLKYDEYLMRD